MKTLMLEVRDRATFIPVLAIKLGSENEGQRYLLGRAGYGVNRYDQDRYVILIKLTGDVIIAQHDPFEWTPIIVRTMHAAHKYIEEHFDSLGDGDVIDVEFILGETKECKVSERYD